MNRVGGIDDEGFHDCIVINTVKTRYKNTLQKNNLDKKKDFSKTH